MAAAGVPRVAENSSLTGIDEEFLAAVDFIAKATKDDMLKAREPLPPMDSLPSESKLTFYSYYKQATEGPNTKAQPSFFYPVERAKWSCWKQLGEMSKEDAKKNYICTVSEYLPQWRMVCSQLAPALKGKTGHAVEKRSAGDRNGVGENPPRNGSDRKDAARDEGALGRFDAGSATSVSAPTKQYPLRNGGEGTSGGANHAMHTKRPSNDNTSLSSAAKGGNGNEFLSAASTTPGESRAQPQTITLEREFEAAVSFVTNASASQKERARGTLPPLKVLSNDQQLAFYSLFKQATDGPCTRGPPPMYKAVERAKWESWRKLGYLSKREAMRQYIKALQADFPDWGAVWADEGHTLSGTLSSLPSSSHIPHDAEPPRSPGIRTVTPAGNGNGGVMSPSCRSYQTATAALLDEDEADGTMTLNNHSFSTVGEELREEIQELRAALRRVEAAVRESREANEATSQAIRTELSRVAAGRRAQRGGSTDRIRDERQNSLTSSIMEWEGWSTTGQVAAAAITVWSVYSTLRRVLRNR